MCRRNGYLVVMRDARRYKLTLIVGEMPNG